MSVATARQRYLRRHIEPALPDAPRPTEPWRNVLVIPAYRESASLLDRLRQLPGAAGRTLVILVLNRPDSDPAADANSALRDAVCALPGAGRSGLHRLNPQSDLYLHDMDTLQGPIPRRQGVGLARKAGCDIAFKWQSAGAIGGRWICTTDADARLPADYFGKLESVPAQAAAASHPFWHMPGGGAACTLATALYELRLHHYVLGLEYAGSPYACHTLGSCIAIDFQAYAAVRGMPKRDGAEDFYLLNKLAKTGPVVRLGGACIGLESRISRRVPFGTGPAVAKIIAAREPRECPLFYHPDCYAALGAVLAAVPHLRQSPLADLPDLLAAAAIAPSLRQACCSTLDSLGLATALDHCRRQGNSGEQFMRQFHQWFDALRTLKFIHGLRDAGWPDCSLAGLHSLQPRWWPATGTDDIDSLRQRIGQHWGWNGCA